MAARAALLIGTTEYVDERLSQLRAPAHDVEAFAEVLRTPELGSFDVQVLIDRPLSELTLAIARFFRRRTRDDLLLFYVSGHGLLDDARQLYFATRETDKDVLSGSAIASSFVWGEMNRCLAGGQVAVLDCCHGGAFAAGAKGAVLGENVETDAVFTAEGQGRVILTASTATQYAFEGEKLVGSPNHSLFTHHMVEGLRSGDADLDGDGRITIEELYRYVWQKIQTTSRVQSPTKSSYGQTGEIVLARSGAVRPRPELIPAEVREDAASPHLYRRRGALAALSEHARGSHSGAAAAARDLISQIASEDDSMALRREAAAALVSLGVVLPVAPPDRAAQVAAEAAQRVLPPPVGGTTEPMPAPVPTPVPSPTATETTQPNTPPAAGELEPAPAAARRKRVPIPVAVASALVVAVVGIVIGTSGRQPDLIDPAPLTGSTSGLAQPPPGPPPIPDPPSKPPETKQEPPAERQKIVLTADEQAQADRVVPVVRKRDDRMRRCIADAVAPSGAAPATVLVRLTTSSARRASRITSARLESDLPNGAALDDCLLKATHGLQLPAYAKGGFSMDYELPFAGQPLAPEPGSHSNVMKSAPTPVNQELGSSEQETLRMLAYLSAQRAADDANRDEPERVVLEKRNVREAAPPTDGEDPAKKAAPEPPPAPAPKRAAAPTPSVEELIRSGWAAFEHRDFKSAVDLATRANTIRPSDEGYQILGACGCATKDQSATSRAYKLISGNGRQVVIDKCRKENINLE